VIWSPIVRVPLVAVLLVGAGRDASGTGTGKTDR
jgi:hypothetical protein